jgi:hypothetical protein
MECRLPYELAMDRGQSQRRIAAPTWIVRAGVSNERPTGLLGH